MENLFDITKTFEKAIKEDEKPVTNDTSRTSYLQARHFPKETYDSGSQPSQSYDCHITERYYNYNKCGKKCFVVSAVSLFLFLIFVALPAGAFLIIHGRHENELGFILGGVAVVCSPIIAVIIITIVFCVYRRKRQATFTSVSNTAKV